MYKYWLYYLPIFSFSPYNLQIRMFNEALKGFVFFSDNRSPPFFPLLLKKRHAWNPKNWPQAPNKVKSPVCRLLLWNKKQKVTGVLAWSNGVYIPSIESTPFRRISRCWLSTACNFFFICNNLRHGKNKCPLRHLLLTLEMIYSTLCCKSKKSAIIHHLCVR